MYNGGGQKKEGYAGGNHPDFTLSCRRQAQTGLADMILLPNQMRFHCSKLQLVTEGGNKTNVYNGFEIEWETILHTNSNHQNHLVFLVVGFVC